MPGVLPWGILPWFGGWCRSPSAAIRLRSVVNVRGFPCKRRPCELYAANTAVHVGRSRGGHRPECFAGGLPVVVCLPRGWSVLRRRRDISRAAQADGGSAGADLADLRCQCHGRLANHRAGGRQDGGSLFGNHRRGRHSWPFDGPGLFARSRLRAGRRFRRCRAPGNASPGGHVHQHLSGESLPGHGRRADAADHRVCVVVRIRREPGRRTGKIRGQAVYGPE